MSDSVETFRDLKTIRNSERKAFGIKCPVCVERLPRANAKILLPGQVWRAHKPHYRDERSPITQEEFSALDIFK